MQMVKQKCIYCGCDEFERKENVMAKLSVLKCKRCGMQKIIPWRW